MVGIVIGVSTAIPTAAAAIFISFAKLNDATQQRSATWRKYFDGFNDEDTKKPTAGTVGEWNLNQKIFSSRISHVTEYRKVEKQS